MTISIIIPCYNVEQYIDRCLKSVVNQTIGLDMLEIIVINDASTDGTLDKLLAWERRFPDNIMVITYEENLRQGGARNAGMQYASGEYIGFVDADDWIEPNMYELLYEKMCTGKYDLVKCKHVRDAGGGFPPMSADSRRDVEYCFAARNGFYYGQVTDVGNCGSYGGLWSGLYQKSMLMEHEIDFPEHLAYEDNYFGAIFWLYVRSLYIVDVVLYHYFVNLQSTVNARNASHLFDRLTIEIMIVEEFKRRGAFEAYHDEIEKNFLERFFRNTWHMIFTRLDGIPDIMDDMKKEILRLFPNYKANPYLQNGWDGILALLEMDDVPLHILEAVKEAYLRGGGFL